MGCKIFKTGPKENATFVFLLWLPEQYKISCSKFHELIRTGALAKNWGQPITV